MMTTTVKTIEAKGDRCVGWADARSPTRQAHDPSKCTVFMRVLLGLKNAAQPTKQPISKPEYIDV